MKIPPWIEPAGAAVSIVAGSYAAYYLMYARPLGRVSTDLATMNASNADIADAIKDRTRVKEQLKGFGTKTLSASVDKADARFRSLLSDIAADGGLFVGSVQINTFKPEWVPNPGGTAKLFRNSKFKDELKKQQDFAVIKGDLTGVGSLESVLRVMAVVKAQPWVHRIESFSIKPEDRDRQKYTLHMAIATLLAPDLTPSNMPDAEITPVPDGGKSLWAGISQKNVFKEPAPIVVVAAPPRVDPPPVAPPRPAIDDWKLTGITEGRAGVLAMLVNTKNKQTVTLPAGSAVAEAKFLSGQGEKAVFEIAGQKFEVFNGQTLEQRRPTDR